MEETKRGVMGVRSLYLGVITLLGEHMERRLTVPVGRERESGGVDGEERWTAGRGKGESIVGLWQTSEGFTSAACDQTIQQQHTIGLLSMFAVLFCRIKTTFPIGPRSPH